MWMSMSFDCQLSTAFNCGEWDPSLRRGNTSNRLRGQFSGKTLPRQTGEGRLRCYAKSTKHKEYQAHAVCRYSWYSWQAWCKAYRASVDRLTSEAHKRLERTFSQPAPCPIPPSRGTSTGIPRPGWYGCLWCWWCLSLGHQRLHSGDDSGWRWVPQLQLQMVLEQTLACHLTKTRRYLIPKDAKWCNMIPDGHPATAGSNPCSARYASISAKGEPPQLQLSTAGKIRQKTTEFPTNSARHRLHPARGIAWNRSEFEQLRQWFIHGAWMAPGSSRVINARHSSTQFSWTKVFQHIPTLPVVVCILFFGIFLWKLSLPSLTRPNWPSASLRGLQGLQLQGLPCGSGQICVSTVSTPRGFQWRNVLPKMICVCRGQHLSGCGTWEARKHTPWQSTRKGQALVENTGKSCDTNSDIQTSDKHTCYPVGTPWSYRALHHASKSASMAPAWGEKNRVPNLSGPGFHISTVANKCKEYSYYSGPPILGPRDWKMHARHQDLIQDVDECMN